jgi:hypothetical protein
MIEIGWGELAGFSGLFLALLGLAYKLGVTVNQVNTNTRNIKSIWAKIDDIHLFVKNGGRR